MLVPVTSSPFAGVSQPAPRTRTFLKTLPWPVSPGTLCQRRSRCTPPRAIKLSPGIATGKGLTVQVLLLAKLIAVGCIAVLEVLLVYKRKQRKSSCKERVSDCKRDKGPSDRGTCGGADQPFTVRQGRR